MSDYDFQLEQRLRTVGARVHEGRMVSSEVIANLCIEVADFLARTRPQPHSVRICGPYPEVAARIEEETDE